VGKVSTIDRDYLSGNVGSCRRGKENDRTGDLVWTAPAAKRRASREMRRDFVVGDHRRIGIGCKIAWRNGIDRDPAWAELGRERAGQRFEATLGGSIGGVTGACDLSGNRAYGDDAPTFSHLRGDHPHKIERRDEVDLEQSAEGGTVEVRDWSAIARTCVADDDIDQPKRGNRIAKSVLVVQVDRKCPGKPSCVDKLGHDYVQPCPVATMNYHLGTRLGETAGDCLAEATARAGDKRKATGQHPVRLFAQRRDHRS
jgi:hypothetical protein